MEKDVFESLAKSGQSPSALVISCIDSRVIPAMIFDAPPGEMLVVRNVANLVPPYAPDGVHHSTSAALEFSVRLLEVRNIIVMGHSSCGGVKALLDGAPASAPEFIGPWMAIAESARVRSMTCSSREECQTCAEHEVVNVSLKNLMTFPWIAERVAAGKLALYGVWFDVSRGELMLLQPDGSFAPPEGGAT
jgi:carbonic anhydrase